MYVIKKNIIKASEIAIYLKKELIGYDLKIENFASIDNIKDNSVIFISEIINNKFLLKENKFKYFKRLLKFRNILAICDENISKEIKCPKIITNNVRLDFIKILKKYFLKKTDEIFLSKKEASRKFNNVKIYDNVYVSKNVKIGTGTVIMPNVVLLGNVSIGKNCLIKSNTVIGNQGFSFVYDSGVLVHFPHIGDVKIGNNVWIGSNVGIERATFKSTIIKDNVKIDDLVQIGHNSIIGEASQITAGSIICGRAKIGKGCWIAPNSVIDNNIYIGKDSLIGTGSVVRNNIKQNSIVAGIPAKLIRKIN